VRKATALAEAGAAVRVVALVAGEAMRELARSRAVTLEERPYDPRDVGDVELVVAATSDRQVNARVCADARQAGRLVNVVDAPEEGSFATMATHRAGQLVIAVGAGGVPGAAARIRDAIALRFDARYARAMETLSMARRALLDSGRGEEWRARSRELTGEAFCELVEQGALDARVATWR
jgi:siroheme synthase-like protein